MYILGIDPGFSITGYCVLQKHQQKIALVDYGYLTLPTKEHLATRIGLFYRFFYQKIGDCAISDVALETPFLGKNAQNFLKLGYLRGNLYLMADQYQLTVHEFSPREVKQAVTGFGGAQKDQVARILCQLFPTFTTPDKQDVTDAIAVTLCAAWRNNRMLYERS